MRRGFVDARRSAADWTGLGRYVRSLSAGLPIVMGEQAPLMILGSGLRRRREPSIRQLTGRIGKPIWEQIGLPLQIAARKPSFIHFPYYEAPLHVASPFILTIPDLDTVISPMRYSRRYRMYYNEILFQLSPRAQRIITISQATASDIGRHLQTVEPDVVYLGIDREFFDADRDRGSEHLSKLGVALDRPLIVAGAGTGLRKNLSVIGLALNHLALGGLPCTLVVTGGSQQTGGLGVPPALAPYREKGIEIVATGVLSTRQLADLYALADVSVTASWFEGFGFAVVESMAAGCPVVASNVGSHPEIGGGAVLLFDPRDDVELATTLRSVIEDRSLADRLRCSGRNRAAAFSWDATVRKTAEIYAQVAAE